MTHLKQQISLIPFSIEHWYSLYKRRRFENRWDQTFCILLITDVLSVTENVNLRQRQNLKQKWSGIRIRIFGLIWIRMSVVYVPKLCMHYLVGVSHFAKYGTNRLLIVWELRKQINANKCPKIVYSSVVKKTSVREPKSLNYIIFPIRVTNIIFTHRNAR